jgi:hypothetical protein
MADYVPKSSLPSYFKTAVDDYNARTSSLQSDADYLKRLFASTGRSNGPFDLTSMLGLGGNSLLAQNLNAMPLLTQGDPVEMYFHNKKNSIESSQSDLQDRYNLLNSVKDLPTNDRFGHTINYGVNDFAPVENKYSGSIGYEGETGWFNSAGQRVNADGSAYVPPVENYYASGGPVEGPGTNTSDSILAKLSNGEYVIPADMVKALGGGSTEKGWSMLDSLREVLKG